MDWNAHVTAFYSQWIVRYVDPSDKPWKNALDFWVVKDLERGRGIVMSKATQFWRNLPAGAKYFRRCFTEFKKLNITQDTSTSKLSPLIKGEYLFENNRFETTLSKSAIYQWHTRLHTYRLHDLAQASGMLTLDREWEAYMHDLCPANVRDKPRGDQWERARKGEWDTFKHEVPMEIKQQLTGHHAPKLGEYVRATNQRIFAMH